MNKDYIVGDIVIFKDEGARREWAWKVGHIPSKLGLPNGCFKTLKAAMAFATELQEIFDLSGDSAEKIIDKRTGLTAIRPAPHDPAHEYNNGINVMAQFRTMALKHGGV